MLLLKHIFQIFKNLRSILAISISITKTSMKTIFVKTLTFIATSLPFKHISCIHHFRLFKKNQAKILVSLDSSKEVNAITLAYATNLSWKLWFTNVKTQKIDNSIIKTFKIVLANFQFQDKFKKSQFFQKTFLVVNTNVTVILDKFLLVFSNANIIFAELKLISRSYTLAEALLITR